MGSKAIVLLGLFLAAFFLISSQVAARELAETSNDVDTSKETNGVVDDAVETDHSDRDRYGRGGGYGYRQGGGGSSRGGNGGSSRGGNGGGNYCRHGCCGNRYHGGCRCCTYAGEKVDAEP